MIRLENKFVVYAACNSGTSAVVTKNGEVYMFGKDTSHCDHASGEYATVMYSSVRLKHYFDAQAKHQWFSCWVFMSAFMIVIKFYVSWFEE